MISVGMVLGRGLAIGLLGGLVACAQVGRPSGGPVDETPPVLISADPGSLAVRVDPAADLRLSFTEKIDRRGVGRALTIIPDVKLSNPHFEDLDVVFRPLHGWPADTVVVWQLAASLMDRHRVRMGVDRFGAFTTRSAFPSGTIRGRATVRDTTITELKGVVAKLSLTPPEGSRRATLWRTARGDAEGNFRLDWLDSPSGPYSLEVFVDANGDGRGGEKERSARIDSLGLAAEDTLLDLGDLLLLDRVSPVDMVFCSDVEDSVPLVVWVAEAPRLISPRTALADSNGCARFSLTPGDYAWGAWKDLHHDEHWGVDSVGVWEDHLEEGIVEVLPEWPDTLRLSGPMSQESISAPADSGAVPDFPEELRAEAPEDSLGLSSP